MQRSVWRSGSLGPAGAPRSDSYTESARARTCSCKAALPAGEVSPKNWSQRWVSSMRTPHCNCIASSPRAAREHVPVQALLIRGGGPEGASSQRPSGGRLKHPASVLEVQSHGLDVQPKTCHRIRKGRCAEHPRRPTSSAERSPAVGRNSCQQRYMVGERSRVGRASLQSGRGLEIDEVNRSEVAEHRKENECVPPGGLRGWTPRSRSRGSPERPLATRPRGGHPQSRPPSSKSRR